MTCKQLYGEIFTWSIWYESTCGYLGYRWVWKEMDK